MANEINIILTDTGLTLVAKLFQGNTQIGSDITLTESGVRSGYYFGDSPANIADGSYTVIIQTNGAVVKGFGTVAFVNGKESNFLQVGELNAISGLQNGITATNTPTSRVAGNVSVTVNGYGTNNTTVKRN